MTISPVLIHSPHSHLLDTRWKRIAIKVTDRLLVSNSDLIETFQFDNMISQAAVSVHGAIARQEIRGAHAREDFASRRR